MRKQMTTNQNDDVIIQFPNMPDFLISPSPTKPSQKIKKRTIEEKVEEAKEFLQLVRTQRKVRGLPIIRREIFDPRNKVHLRSYQQFLQSGKWGDVQFYAEYPFETVVETVAHHFSIFAIGYLLAQ